jgi:hypothetical protein
LTSQCGYILIEIQATNPVLATAEERLAVVSNDAATGGAAFNSQAGPFSLGGGNYQQPQDEDSNLLGCDTLLLSFLTLQMNAL